MLRDRLRQHDRCALIDQYRFDRIPHLAAQLEALDTWRRWAWGDSIDVQTLSGAVDTFLAAAGHQDGRYRTLGQAVQHWAIDAGMRLPAPESAAPTLEVAGPELGL